MPAIHHTTTRRWWLVLTLAVLVPVLLLASAPLWLPAAVAPALPLVLKRVAPGLEAHAEIRRVGWRGADLHGVTVGPAEAPGLQADLVRLDWRLPDLWRRRLAAVSASGLTLRLERTPEGLRLPGWPSEGPVRDPRGAPPEIPELAARLGRLAIRHARLQIDGPTGRQEVPFEACLDPAPDGGLRGRLTLSHGPGRAAMELHLIPLPEGLDLTLEARIPELADWHALAPGLLQGEAGLWARIRWPAGSSVTAEGRLEIRGGRLALGPLLIQGLEGGSSPPGLLHLRLQTLPGNVWHLAAGPLRLTGPLDAVVPRLEGRLNAVQGLLTATGDLAMEVVAAGRVPPEAGRDGPLLRLAARWQGRRDAAGRWEAQVDAAADPASGPSPRLQWAGGEGRAAALTLRARAAGSGASGEAEAALALEALQARHAGADLRIPNATADLAARWASGQPLDMNFQTRIQSAVVKTPALALTLPQLTLQGRLDAPRPENLGFNGRLAFEGLSARRAGQPYHLAGGRGELPLTWPPPPKEGPAGRLQASLAWNPRLTAELRGSLRQTPEGLAFQSQVTSGALPGLRLDARGRLQMDPAQAAPLTARLEASLQQPGGPRPISLASLNPDWADWRFTGRLAGHGAWDQRGSVGSGRAGLEVLDGRLDRTGSPAMGVEGLSLKLALPDLPSLRSAPRQTLAWTRAFAGDLTATDGQALLQVEPGPVLFLEDGRFRWCDGTVQVAATRLDPAAPVQDIVLIADRIKIVPLLAQLGIARAEGAGSVSGKVPLQIAGGDIVFGDGFLYSTPGEGGTLRLEAADFLGAGGQPGTQLEIARQALQDYDYEWVKLHLASSGEDLRLQLQLDGKPARSLPFVYDPGQGGLVPAGPGHPGSTFQGIRLDVNFRLPLNRLLKYKDILKSLE